MPSGVYERTEFHSKIYSLARKRYYKSLAGAERKKEISKQHSLYDKRYLVHFKRFNCMHNRRRDRGAHVASDFDQTPEGFINFVRYLGPVPKDMLKPSLGRYDHDKGYIRGNFRWQEYIENISDPDRCLKRQRDSKGRFI